MSVVSVVFRMRIFVLSVSLVLCLIFTALNHVWLWLILLVILCFFMERFTFRFSMCYVLSEFIICRIGLGFLFFCY